MPYPNEHACRLADPNLFQSESFRTSERIHEGKKYAVILAKKKGQDTMSEQAFRYDKHIWTADQAMAHCKAHHGTFHEAMKDSAKCLECADERGLTHNSMVASSEPDWGSVDKTKLPRQAFADQGEAEKKSTWSYPHHWVKNGQVGNEGYYTSGDLYLHKGGLNAAWAAANGAHTGNKASQTVLNHLQAHRRALGLDQAQKGEPMGEEIIKRTELFRRSLPASSIEVRMDAGKSTKFLMFPASSEQPVERWYGMEVLSHQATAVKLGRAANGSMPLLFNHDINQPIGMIHQAYLENHRMMVEATMFATDRAKEVEAMIEAGLRNVSLAYRVNTIEENKQTDTFTVTDWEPYEVSIVTVPADPSVGIGRGIETEYEVRMIRYSETNMSHEQEVTQPVISQRRITMPTDVIEEKEKDQEKKITGVEAEKERRQACLNLGESNRIDPRVIDRWISDGTPLSKVADEILEIMQERGKQRPLEAARLGLSANESKRYSLFNAVRYLKFRTPELREKAAFEIDCSNAVAKRTDRGMTSNLLVPSEVLERPLSPESVTRAMATTPASKGGYLVNTTNMGFIDILRNRSVAMNMGARVLSGLQGNVTFARQTGKVSVTWQAGEGVSVTAADQTLGQLSMTPKTCIAITDVSEQLLAQSSPSAESFVMADLAADVAIDGVDNAVINGTGGAQPLGIKNTTGITSGQDAASATYAKMLAFISAAGAVNAIRGNPGWVTNIAGSVKLMQVQRFTSTDTPVWTGNPMDGTLVGFRGMSSEQLASGNIIFGSWDEVVIGEWGVLELSTDNGGTRFNTAQVGIRAIWMVDVMLRYPQAFVVSTNLS